MFKLRVTFTVLAASALLGVLVFAPVSAQNVTQGYVSSGDVQNGMVVQLVANDKTQVTALSQEKEIDALGVAVSASESPVSLSDPSQQQVYVATIGRYQMLVSTQNGPIKSGDSIVISSVKGVAMKSDGEHQVILGKALQNFADNSNAEGHIKLSTGKTVALGRMQVDVAISRNPGYNGDSIAGVPSFLSSAAKTVSNKPVTALRLYACLAVLFVALSIGGGILYAGARSGMLAVGRNPLAKKSIFRSMATVIVMAMVVVIIGVFGVYLILKL